MPTIFDASAEEQKKKQKAVEQQLADIQRERKQNLKKNQAKKTKKNS
ncbi:hypothetical protein LRY60_04885 [Candidatus Woesebacteria bacterium]|nr:hypothetical protein [Candidatus Woesebacteria bacterium]